MLVRDPCGRHGLRQVELDREDAALSRRAPYLEDPPHELGEPLADRQTQAGTLTVAARVVELTKRLEDLLELVWMNSDSGVLDLEAETCGGAPLGLAADSKDDAPLVGELGGVAQQVEQNLTQPPLVTANGRRQRRCRLIAKCQPLVLGSDAGDLGDPLQEGRQVEVGRRSLKLSGLDLRQREDVVDQRQKVLATALDDADGLGL